MNYTNLIFLSICLLLTTITVEAQYTMAESDLLYQMYNVQHNPINSASSESQDKSNLGVGTTICIDRNGTLTRAMVTGYSGQVYGPNRDAYSISITEGPESRLKVYLKESEIESVGECPETYVPRPNDVISPNLDIRKFEQAIIKEVNIVRANPTAYANEMAKIKFKEFGKKNNRTSMAMIGNDRMWGCNPSNTSCQSDYEKKLQVAIAYLRSLPGPLGALKENTRLNEASRLLAADTGPGNSDPHKDSQGRNPWERGRVAGYQNQVLGECLNSGHSTAAGFVVSFLGSPGHRDILMKKDINEIGVDLHLHGTGDDAYLRDVIIVGRDPNQPTGTSNTGNSGNTGTAGNTGTSGNSGGNTGGGSTSVGTTGNSGTTGNTDGSNNTTTTINPTTTTPTLNPVAMRARFYTGQKLNEGQYILSPNGRYRFGVTTEGELVIQEIINPANGTTRLVWKAPAKRRLNLKPMVSYFSFNNDCNICFESKLGVAWCATTGRDNNTFFIYKCGYAEITDDGRLVVFSKTGQELIAFGGAN